MVSQIPLPVSTWEARQGDLHFNGLWPAYRPIQKNG